ncbi:MAG: OsmC family protein [Candidatus Phytoplasma stylosanthis]|nr:OsmC family protein [Candidatus Phytoplasma stylosanthis]
MNKLQITAYYEDKFKDIGIIKNGLRTKLVSAFMNDNIQDCSSPKELFSLSLVLCFYKSAKKVLISKNKPTLDVKVKVLCDTLIDKKGYFFRINLFCGIQELSISEIKNIVEETHKKCPVSRILNDYHQFTVNSVEYNEI